jgi:hypothetical protein
MQVTACPEDVRRQTTTHIPAGGHRLVTQWDPAWTAASRDHSHSCGLQQLQTLESRPALRSLLGDAPSPPA